MPSIALMAGSLALLGCGIGLLVIALVPGKKRKAVGVPGALEAIERGYASKQPTRDRGKAAAAMPEWLVRIGSKLSREDAIASLQRRLDLAGNPPKWTADRVLGVKALGMIVLAGIGALYGLKNIGLLILLVAVGAAAGFFLPDLLLYNSRLKRQERIQTGLPDALDMLTVCVEAGLGFDQALAQVARNTRGPIAAEFARALQEVQIGKSRSDALRAMAERTAVPELRIFVSALTQAAELGIPMAQVLREQSKDMRLRRRQRAEELAQKVSVKILFPLVCCLFPALFIIIIGPGALRIAHTLLGL